MKNIRFSHNWNGKLNNWLFTTIRKVKGGEDYYGEKVGSVFNIVLKDNTVCAARLLEAKKISFCEIPELVLMLDTGRAEYDAALRVFQDFYGDFNRDDPFYVLVFQRVSK